MVLREKIILNINCWVSISIINKTQNKKLFPDNFTFSARMYMSSFLKQNFI